MKPIPETIINRVRELISNYGEWPEAARAKAVCEYLAAGTSVVYGSDAKRLAKWAVCGEESR